MHVFDVFMQGWANGIVSRNRNKIIISFKEKTLIHQWQVISSVVISLGEEYYYPISALGRTEHLIPEIHIYMIAGNTLLVFLFFLFKI